MFTVTVKVLKVKVDQAEVPVVELDGAVGDGVVLEAHEVQVQHGREGGEDHALLRLLQPVLARVVLVLAVQRLRADVVLERLVDCGSHNVTTYVLLSAPILSLTFNFTSIFYGKAYR